MEQNPSPKRIAAVDRALTLLTLLGTQDNLAVTDAARALDVAPSTAHRLLSTLVHREFAVQDRQRRYAAGPALLIPGQARSTPSLVSKVRPYLEQLFEATEETCHLAVRQGIYIRFVDGIEGTQALRVGLRTDMRMPAHQTSGGKAMLAELGPQEVVALFPPRPPTIPSEAARELDRLAEQLATVRERRLGLNRDETEQGVTALGATLGIVVGHHAALSVAVPTARLTTKQARELSRQLIRICEAARTDLPGV